MGSERETQPADKKSSNRRNPAHQAALRRYLLSCIVSVFCNLVVNHYEHNGNVPNQTPTAQDSCYDLVLVATSCEEAKKSKDAVDRGRAI
jgi:hypothetical protein